MSFLYFKIKIPRCTKVRRGFYLPIIVGNDLCVVPFIMHSAQCIVHSCGVCFADGFKLRTPGDGCPYEVLITLVEGCRDTAPAVSGKESPKHCNRYFGWNDTQVVPYVGGTVIFNF